MLSVRIVFLGVLSTLAAFSSGSRCFRDYNTEPPYLLCYHTGKTSLNEVNVSNCTHLVLTNAVTKTVPGNKLVLGEGINKDLRVVKEKNPNLAVIFTLNAGKNESVALLESTNKTKNLVEEVNSFLQETTFDGVELNFEFTAQTGGSKHSYTSFVKLLSKSLDSAPRRTKRSYEVVEKGEEDEEDVTERVETTSVSGETEQYEQDATERVETTSVGGETEQEDEENDPALENADEMQTTTDSQTAEETGSEREDSETVCENRNAWLLIRLPVKLDVIGKKYDLKALSRYADLISVSTHNIVNDNAKDTTYHPSRLMGLSDIYNTDSILDFILGMGATKSRIVVGLPSTALRFHLKNSTKNTPGSPVESAPTTIDQVELCSLFKKENWTLERDEDLTAPYAYAGKSWMAFEDEISVSIKGKYILLRELGGGAIYSIDDDVNDEKCTKRLKTGGYLTSILASNFRNYGRKPRALVLESLQNEIHDRGYSSIEAGVKLSEYRIVRVVDHSGAVHVIRRNTKTQFECSRQGYFSHPLGCNRFYRCVKFDQYSDEFTVFEYDCPAGLAFDERWEVCVWPGSLPNGAPCTGSSEIAPVPRSHYKCPSQEGYYGDPENCRWFFACLDHARDGITPLTAYEFRCPFGLVFNQEKLACDWPWIVGSCGNAGGVGYLGSSSAVHTSTFLNGGNLEASYGQYGKNEEEASFSSFGRGFGSSFKNGNGFSGAGGDQRGDAGIGYIASQFDGRDGSNRAPFASYPDFEVSGGRVHNKGGVILQENVNFGGASSGKTGALDFGTQSYGVPVTSKGETVGGLGARAYAGGHGSSNSLLGSVGDSESNLYKQAAGGFGETSFGSAAGSAFNTGSGLFKASQNGGLYKSSNRGGASGNLIGKAYGYGESGIEQNIQLKNTENGGVYGDRSSSSRKPASPAAVPESVPGISLTNQSPYTYLGSSLSDGSLHTTYQQAGDDSGNGNKQQSFGAVIEELYTNSHDSNAITPTVAKSQSSYPSIKPVNPSTSTLLNTPAATFVSSTVQPITHIKGPDHLDIRGSAAFGDISYSSPHPQAGTTPSSFATTVGSTATTEAQLFVPVKTEKPQYKEASFGHGGKYTISSTLKPFAAVSSATSSANKDDESLRGSLGTTFPDTGFSNSKNSLPYENSVGGASSSSFRGGYGASYESEGRGGGSFISPGSIAVGGDYSSSGGSSFSHSFGKSSGDSNEELTGDSKFPTGGSAYGKITGKTIGNTAGGLYGGSGFSTYGNSASNSILSSAHQGRFETGSTAFGKSLVGSYGSSGLYNSYGGNTVADGSHESFGSPTLSDLGKSTADSSSTSFGNINQESASVSGSASGFGSSNGYLLNRGYDKSILGTSSSASAGGIPLSSFSGPTASSSTFEKFSNTVGSTYGSTGTGSSSGFLLKGSHAGTLDGSVGSVYIGTSGISSGDSSTGISGTSLGGSYTGTSGVSLGPSTFQSSTTSHKELSGSTLFDSALKKIIDSNKAYKIPNPGFSDASLEGGLVKSHKNLASSDVTSASPLDKTFEAPGQTAFGSHIHGTSGFGQQINAFGQTSQDTFQHSVSGSPSASFVAPGGGSLNSYSVGSTFTSSGGSNVAGASYGTKLSSSSTNTFGTSEPDSLPHRYQDFVKGSFGKTYGMPIMDSTLTSHGSLYATSGNAGISSYAGIQPNSEQSHVTFVPPVQTLKATISTDYKNSDFSLNTGTTADYEKSNGNFITAPGFNSNPTVKPFETFYPGFHGSAFKTQIKHQSEGENNFNSQAQFEQTGSGKDSVNNSPFENLHFSKQTYGEPIQFSNQATNIEQPHANDNNPFLAVDVNQSTGTSHSPVSNSFGSQYSGNSFDSSGFNNNPGGGQTFKIVVPNIRPSYAPDTSEKFQHATDVTVEKQPIVQVADIEPVGYDYKESTQETITTKGQLKGSGSFGYAGIKTVPSQPNHVSTVTPAPSVTTFAPFTYKHGHTTAATTPLRLRPDYLEPIIHNRTQLIRTKILAPVVTSTTQLPTESTIYLTSPKPNAVKLKPLLPTQVTYPNVQYSQGETSSTSLYRDDGSSEKVKIEAQNVVEVTPKPVTYHGTYETTGNKHVIIQSEESSGSDQGSLNNIGQQATNGFGQKSRGYVHSSDLTGGTYYNEQLLESAKPTIQTTTKVLTTTEPYKPSLHANTFAHQQPLPVSPSETSLPETKVYNNGHQSDFADFSQFGLAHQHDSVLSNPSISNHFSVVTPLPDTTSSRLASPAPVTEYHSPSTERTTAGLDLSRVNFKATSLGHEYPAATFEYSSNPLESYEKFFQEFNRSTSDSSLSSKVHFSSGIRGGINPKIEISPPPKEYILEQQLSVQAGGEGEKAGEYSTNEGANGVRGFAYASRGGATFQDGINGKGSYQTTITGGLHGGQVPDLYKGRYGKVITDEAFGEKLSGLHYDVMKTNAKTRQKGKGRQYHGTLISDVPATNKYEEYEIEHQRQFDNSGRGGAFGTGRALPSNINHSYDEKAKKKVFVSQTSDANPILVGKLAGQCSCQSNLLEVKEVNKQSTGARQKGNKQGNEAANILKYTEPSVTGTSYTKGSTLSGLGGHDVDYLPTGSPSFQPDDVVSIVPQISPKAKQFRGKARFLSPSPHLYYSGPDSSLPSPIWASQITHGESGEESRTRNEIHAGFSKSRGGAAFDRYGPGGWRPFDETLQGSVDCKRPGLFRHPKYCNKFYACNYDPWEERFTLHIFNCPIRLTYDNSISACNWPVGGPACANDNLLV